MTTENQHRPNDFTPVVGAMNLAEYVFLITDNTNKFGLYVQTHTHREGRADHPPGECEA